PFFDHEIDETHLFCLFHCHIPGQKIEFVEPLHAHKARQEDASTAVRSQSYPSVPHIHHRLCFCKGEVSRKSQAHACPHRETLDNGDDDGRDTPYETDTPVQVI